MTKINKSANMCIDDIKYMLLPHDRLQMTVLEPHGRL